MASPLLDNQSPDPSKHNPPWPHWVRSCDMGKYDNMTKTKVDDRITVIWSHEDMRISKFDDPPDAGRPTFRTVIQF